MESLSLEQRMTALEQLVAVLQKRLDKASGNENWIDRITGSISDEEAFLEALEHGRRLRATDSASVQP